MDRAASGLVKIRDRDGPRALAGFGSAKGSNEEAYLFQKLVRTGFGSNNVDHCTRLCHASSVAALLEGVGSAAVTATFNECKNSDVIIVIGANPTENHPVAATFFKQAAKRGAKLIVMDPRGQALKRHAWQMMQFKNGTDVAMLNGILNVIIGEKLYDQQYVQTYTEDFDKLAESVKPFTPEEMSPICGIEPDVLRTVARTFARAESAIIFWGMGVSQHTHGTDNARCLIALSLICGQVGRPGTGLHPLRGQNNVQGASDAGLIPMFFPDYKSVENAEIRAKYEAAWGVTLDPKRGKTVVEIMDAVHADEIKGMYIMGENPAMSDPDLNHARGALAHLEHLVVQDIFLTETASYADVILPASAWPEKDGTVTNTNRQVQMGRAALPLPGEARQDLWIIQDLAQRIGCNWNYKHVGEVFTEMASMMPALDNISWDRVERENHVTYPVDGPDVPGRDVVFDKGFPRPNGFAKLVATKYTAPDEMPDAEYPFILTTGRQLEHWHTGAMTRRASTLDALEPGPVAGLSRGTISKLGIKPGDLVRVSTRRGVVELDARQDDAVPDGVVFIPFAYVEAAANLLTNPALDPFGKIPEFKYCAAKVEAVDQRRGWRRSRTPRADAGTGWSDRPSHPATMRPWTRPTFATRSSTWKPASKGSRQKSRSAASSWCCRALRMISGAILLVATTFGFVDFGAVAIGAIGAAARRHRALRIEPEHVAADRRGAARHRGAPRRTDRQDRASAGAQPDAALILHHRAIAKPALHRHCACAPPADDEGSHARAQNPRRLRRRGHDRTGARERRALCALVAAAMRSTPRSIWRAPVRRSRSPPRLATIPIRTASSRSPPQRRWPAI